MAKNRNLKAALDRHQGVDHKLERQRKQQKQAEKRKKQQREKDLTDGLRNILASDADEDSEATNQALITDQLAEEELAADAAEEVEAEDGEFGGWETDESEDADDGDGGGIHIDSMEEDSDSESDDGEIVENGISVQPRSNGAHAGADEDAEDIPLSDIESLASEDKGDVMPHQRLTINNTAALQRSLKSFALPSSLPFSATQSVTTAEPIQIADVDDDLNRELAFYKQSLDAVKEARSRLKKQGVPFSRPADYFAEMVKSEEQMGKVRQKMVDEAARKKASSDARRQRDLKKFGKAVQVAKLQERDKAKRDTLDKINVLKRSMLLTLAMLVTIRLTSKQNDKAPTLLRMKTTCSMLHLKTLLTRRKPTELHEEQRELQWVLTGSARRRMKGLVLEGRRDLPRVMIRNRLVIRGLIQ